VKRRRSAAPAALGLVLVVALATGGCTAGVGRDPGDWSRSYVSTYDRVFEAALDSLEEIDFYLDTVEKDRGRIHAEASVRRGDEVTLIVHVDERPSEVRVDVMARGIDAEDGMAPGRTSAVVFEFLRNLDERLEGRRD
jgi:hypothetical protein